MIFENISVLEDKSKPLNLLVLIIKKENTVFEIFKYFQNITTYGPYFIITNWCLKVFLNIKLVFSVLNIKYFYNFEHIYV